MQDAVSQHLAFLGSFGQLTDTEYLKVQKLQKSRVIKKGEYIVSPGQIQREFYFVKAGVQMSYFLVGHKTHVTEFTYPPIFRAILGSFTSQTTSNFFLISLSDSELDYLIFQD